MDKNNCDVGTDKYSPDWILSVKSSVRPMLTYIFTILYIYVFIEREHMDVVYINGLNNIMAIIIVFWFGERLMRNTGITEFLKGFRGSSNESK